MSRCRAWLGSSELGPDDGEGGFESSAFGTAISQERPHGHLRSEEGVGTPRGHTGVARHGSPAEKCADDPSMFGSDNPHHAPIPRFRTVSAALAPTCETSCSFGLRVALCTICE
eukprot:TRINITY_DN43867_c0_g1_i1.p3 TRINITY_DN43867_c0_g1~~TRINITY_DN43867_c0_g1_i1.p3  ORF type:complete len:114 (-),score=10.70 TRINITY_DN43867_c0_g1_i1:150-491(-)